MDSRTVFDNLRLDEHNSPQNRRYAKIDFDLIDIKDRAREIKQDVASLERIVKEDVFKEHDTLDRLSSTIESIAYSLYILGIEYNHINRLISRSERAHPIAEFDTVRSELASISLSALRKTYETALSRVLDSISKKVLGDEYKEIQSAIQSGLVSPSDYSRLNKLMSQAEKRIELLVSELPNDSVRGPIITRTPVSFDEPSAESQQYQHRKPPVLAGDLGDIHPVLKRRFLSFGEVLHVLTLAYANKSPNMGRRDIYHGIKPDKDTIALSDATINPTRIRLDLVGVYTGNARKAYRNFGDLTDKVASDRRVIQDLSARYDTIMRERTDIVTQFHREVDKYRGAAIDRVNLPSYEKLVLVLDRFLQENSWLSAQEPTYLREYQGFKGRVTGLRSQIVREEKAKEEYNILVRQAVDILSPHEFAYYSHEIKPARVALAEAESLFKRVPGLDQERGVQRLYIAVQSRILNK